MTKSLHARKSLTTLSLLWAWPTMTLENKKGSCHTHDSWEAVTILHYLMAATCSSSRVSSQPCRAQVFLLWCFLTKLFHLASTSPVVTNSWPAPSEYQVSYENLSPSRLPREMNSAKYVFSRSSNVKSVSFSKAYFFLLCHACDHCGESNHASVSLDVCSIADLQCLQHARFFGHLVDKTLTYLIHCTIQWQDKGKNIAQYLVQGEPCRCRQLFVLMLQLTYDHFFDHAPWICHSKPGRWIT